MCLFNGLFYSLIESFYLLGWVTKKEKFICPHCRYPIRKFKDCPNCFLKIDWRGYKK